MRQTGILLAHAEFGVPLGHQFLMWDLTVGLRPENLLVQGTPRLWTSPSPARTSNAVERTCPGCTTRP
ncbi:hypothetical protein NQP46_00660 [Streptomyces albus]|nr:hypothetical protein NQP46_00660 [Streptomyces albus]